MKGSVSKFQGSREKPLTQQKQNRFRKACRMTTNRFRMSNEDSEQDEQKARQRVKRERQKRDLTLFEMAEDDDAPESSW